MNTALDIFEARFPDAQALFIFDQSSAHGSFASDALLAHKMNAGPGGNQPKMRDTMIPIDNPDPSLRGCIQSMIFPPGHKDAGLAKGMIQIIKEHHLYNSLSKDGKKPLRICHDCRKSEEQRQKAREAAEAQLRSSDETCEGIYLIIHYQYN